MKHYLKKLGTAFEGTTNGLDGIINALTRIAPEPPEPPEPPVPPPYDPLLDPEKTVFVMQDGTKKVLTNIIENDGKWDEESPGYEKDYLFLYFDGSETPADSSMYTDVVGMKLGTQFEIYQYNTSGTTIFCPIEGAVNGYESCNFSGLQWVKFEHIGNIDGLLSIYNEEPIHINGLSQLSSIEFPLSADGKILLGGDSNLSVINHPNGQIFKDNGDSWNFFDGCDELTTINFPSSGYVTNTTGSADMDYPPQFPSTVESITIPANLSFDFGNYTFTNQKDIYFEGMTMAEVKALDRYPTAENNYTSMFGYVSDVSAEYNVDGPTMYIHCTDGVIPLYFVS